MAYTRTTWVDYPATTTPITAARLNNIETGILAIEAGQGAITNGIYTNEAARDAAITSPTEGMRVYLTSPTVPAATGLVQLVPTGVQTIYNGSVWVCVTDVVSLSTTATTNTSWTTSYTTPWTAGTGGDLLGNSVTLVTGTTALVTVAVNITAPGSGYGYTIGVAVSGATTIAASDANSCGVIQGTSVARDMTASATLAFTGLTAGTNTFTLSGRSSAAISAQVSRRQISVRGIA